MGYSKKAPDDPLVIEIIRKFAEEGVTSFKLVSNKHATRLQYLLYNFFSSYVGGLKLDGCKVSIGVIKNVLTLTKKEKGNAKKN